MRIGIEKKIGSVMVLLIAVCLGIIGLAFSALGDINRVAIRNADYLYECKNVYKLSLALERNISPAKLMLSTSSVGEKELFRNGIFAIDNAAAELGRQPGMDAQKIKTLAKIRHQVEDIDILANKTFFSNRSADEKTKFTAARVIDWRLSNILNRLSRWRQINQEGIEANVLKSQEVGRIKMQLLAGSLAILFIGASLALIFTRLISKPILELHEGIERVRRGDIAHKVVIKTNDQIQDLADTFNRLVYNLRQEEETASEIQRRLVPQKKLRAPGVRVYARQTHAKLVGGDWFDYYRFEDEVRLLIADASGKGMPGALLATVGMSTIRSEPKLSSTIESILRRTNKTIVNRFGSADFITLMSARLSLSTMKFAYTNCGHEPPLHYDAANRLWTMLSCPSGLPLGISTELFNPGSQHMILAPGDKIVFYTDGLHDVRNKKNRFLTMEDILAWLNRQKNMSIEHLTDALLKKAVDYGPIIDDITLLGLEIEATQIQEYRLKTEG
jgi:serine phosphatase RsbU (regulator of sigma subunit)